MALLQSTTIQTSANITHSINSSVNLFANGTNSYIDFTQSNAGFKIGVDSSSANNIHFYTGSITDSALTLSKNGDLLFGSGVGLGSIKSKGCSNSYQFDGSGYSL